VQNEFNMELGVEEFMSKAMVDSGECPKCREIVSRE
jgi:hypothetical protein